MACPLTATFIRATTPLKYHKRYKRLVIVRLCAPIWMSTVFYQFITSRLTWRFLTFDNSDQSCLYHFFSDFKTKADPRCSQVRMLTSAFPITLFMSLRLHNKLVKRICNSMRILCFWVRISRRTCRLVIHPRHTDVGSLSIHSLIICVEAISMAMAHRWFLPTWFPNFLSSSPRASCVFLSH